jgi:DNA (cytosine-5)-methyltransferase 1
VADALGTATDAQRMPDQGRFQAIVEPVGCTVTSKWAKGSGGPAGSETQNIIAIQERAVSENPGNGPGGAGVRTDGAAYTLESRSQVQAVAFAQNQREEVREMEVAGALASEPGMKQQTYLRQHMAVRRLTPEECELLQGFSRGYTNVPYRGKPAADGPRYKALGNSMAVNVMAWIGQRTQLVSEIADSEAAA